MLYCASDERRHPPWPAEGAALGRKAMDVNNVPGSEWTSWPHPSEVCRTVEADGHENTLEGDTGAWCGCVTHPRGQRRGSQLWGASGWRTRVSSLPMAPPGDTSTHPSTLPPTR